MATAAVLAPHDVPTSPHRTGIGVLQPRAQAVAPRGPDPDEVMLIKCYDSEENRARLTPHSAFTDASSPSEAPHWESIGVRALVFDSE